MKTLPTRFVLVLCAMLGGCATSYSPTGDYGGFPHGGYTDSRIDANTEVVTFTGNIFTPQKDVETYLLYRCAKVTIENGYRYFVVVSTSSTPVNIDLNTHTTYKTQINPPKLKRTYSEDTKLDSYSTSGTRTQPFYQANPPCSNTQAHGASSVIKMFSGTAPTMPNAYNAYDVIAHLEPALGPSVF